MARTLAQWVDLWFDGAHEGADPRALVAPLLTLNAAPDEGWREGDVQVLVVEQQGAWLWGRNDCGDHVEREHRDGVPWRSTGEDAEAFWLHHAAFEAVWSMPARRSAQDLDGEAVAEIVGRATPLPCQPWAWPGTGQRVYHRDSAVVMVCEDGDDFWVIAAAPSEADLAWVDDLGLVWDETDSRRD